MKRYNKMRVVRRFLDALKVDSISSEVLPEILHALRALSLCKTAHLNHRDIATFITYALHDDRASQSANPLLKTPRNRSTSIKLSSPRLITPELLPDHPAQPGSVNRVLASVLLKPTRRFFVALRPIHTSSALISKYPHVGSFIFWQSLILALWALRFRSYPEHLWKYQVSNRSLPRRTMASQHCKLDCGVTGDLQGYGWDVLPSYLVVRSFLNRMLKNSPSSTSWKHSCSKESLRYDILRSSQQYPACWKQVSEPL
jgi:hypothetical protein